MNAIFHLYRGAVSDGRASAIQAVLDEHECVLVAGYRDHPRAPERGWVSGPNLGAPFDAALADEVQAALEAADLWPIPDEGRTRGRPYELTPSQRRRHRVRCRSLTDAELAALDRAAGGKHRRGSYLYRLLMAALSPDRGEE